MEETELRIGNLFIEQNSKEIIEVIGLEKNRIVFSGMFLEEWQAKPITLTEEWIVKFGIGKENGYPYIFNKGFLKLRNGIFIFKYYDIEIELPYVHNLQNLQFTLTNTELKCEKR